MAPGTYHYTSGLIDSATLEFKGTIEVLPEKSLTLPGEARKGDQKQQTKFQQFQKMNF